jgi:AraC-like DNA-binding protein
MTAVQPAASAGARERIVSATGEFQGAMMPATPIGWRRISEMLPGFGVTARPLVEAAHRIFADPFEMEIAFDQVGECAGQQHRFPQLFGEGFETRSHIDRRADDGEVEPGVQSRLPVKRISQRCGFCSEETMRRSFLRLLSATPSDYRAGFSS